MPTITVGTNSYETLVEANAYLDGAIHGGPWKFLPTATRERALITAFRDISIYDLIDPETGVAIDPLLAPQPVKDAQSELAFAFSQDPSLATSQTRGGSNTKRVKAGSAEVEFWSPERGSRFPPIVMRLLGPYLSSASSGVGGSESFGTGACSTFGDIGGGLTQGYM